MTTQSPVLWDSQKERVYAFLDADENGVYRSRWGNKTIEEMVASGEVSKAYQILSLDDAFVLSEKAARNRYCKGVESITEARFWELLEVLPPARWIRQSNFEAFHVSECISGDLYQWCIRKGDKYYAIVESCGISMSDLLEKVDAYEAGK